MLDRHPASEVPDVGGGLWERVRDAVLAESGAATSLWNGQLKYTDPEKKILGSAAADGTLRLGKDRVVRPLQEMSAHRGGPVEQKQLRAWRNALETVVHEFCHLAAEAGFTHADRKAGMKRPELGPIEEGTTEAWSQARLDRIIDRVVPPELARQLTSVRTTESYPAWAPAVRAFAQDLGAETRLDFAQVLDQMSRAGRAGKAQVAADLLFKASELPFLVPLDAQAAIREELRATIDQGFADLRPLNENRPPDLPVVAGRRGQEIARAAVLVVRRAETRFQPPRASERIVGRQTTPLDREIAGLRAVLDAQSPTGTAAGAQSQTPSGAGTVQDRPRLDRPTDGKPRTR
ncbi:hypothetical protein [Kribbella lupini]|uniref:Uncharacterized protein n=1 Tax=Kribbella lupini TaxID=291602 RepID=A0ABN2AXF7_9ACTN